MLKEEKLDEVHHNLLVGRKQEIQTFIQLLEETILSKNIISVYGTAGIGKSFLLDKFERLSREYSAVTITIDSEGFVKTPHAFCEHILDKLQNEESSLEPSQMPLTCVHILNKVAALQRVVLIIDAYEYMESLDQWLRDYFLKHLSKNVLIVIAGRYPLSQAWFVSPSWRSSIVRMPLSELDYQSVAQYAKNNDVMDEETIQRLWRYSNGHPLTLSLTVFLHGQDGFQELASSIEDDLSLPFLVNEWIREVPDEHMRPFIEASCILRHFNQEMLSFVMDQDISASEFYQLIRFSFIRKVDRGWTVHNLMRDAVNRELLARTPQLYEKIRNRALQYYYKLLTKNNKQLPNTRDAVEVMYYTGDSLIRALMNWIDLAPKNFEAVDSKSSPELEAYVQKRLNHAKDTRIELFDPYSNKRFDFFLSAEETCFTVKQVDFHTLFSLGYDVVRIMRDNAGEIIGFAVIIPINSRTLPYLKKAPRSSTYFNHLSPNMEKRLSVPANTRAGWFIETVDTLDYGDSSQQAAIGHLLYSLIITGELIVESPAPIPYFIESHLSLGYEIVPNGWHYNYDGKTKTPTFVIDLQSENVVTYINRMLKMTGQEYIVQLQEASPSQVQQVPSDRILARNDITPREKEVAKLIEQGYTNAEIASTLFLSEVTVKKHIKSMFDKLNASNRTQLLKKLLE
ncbi:LuxR C-terminal-related transcriptional regulator [Metabacillus sp. Hm71]|uniref:response regulator transcription factor n=1 Tax=Metabacillus sp. Hm71 TaxID=3450743 RepID=UPI003F43E706